ncbi:tripartite motif-containing protein 3-like [Saccostrea echinata]|uniref:tripartite motif-containing protein 3-like n=1 Tax=Saccostrea echinata TaxID=191078 RepID=UPI002A8203BE|nr:tripartite motif-containing protein 3-like [Saccostrea echinata]XP_061162724.1 tripartite motif-containing protein 3-like [Saccostrea echinata]XP_061162725.1 tripartite motif-containing protein 3-like [Saccostrea echinata]XP_061162726.1 tripartite motif-containing protein 3-like [Saccostrea echinata]
MMSQTLVETVSINYEDFNDSFLTCGTCLCIYDAVEHSPKLLPCSHTVCKNCLERIVEAQVHDTGYFRCPICREHIGIPRGGVVAFPPSYIVNQLLDLMQQQRRDVIPKCSTHSNQELLFCETCDSVFCTQCSGGQHNGAGASQHTVIPFSIAIKRMSEILLYKAHLCIKNLNHAYDNVSAEMQLLENSVEKTVESINRSFQDIIAMVDKRRHDCLQWVRKIREDKRKILREQLDLIQAEKDRVQSDCDGLQFQVEVRNITKKIGDLNEKLDATNTLSEPRENSFMKYEFKHNSSMREISKALNEFGKINTSTTFPALCSAKTGEAITHLKSSMIINTVDYHGNPRTSGSDPVCTEVRTEKGELVESKVRDRDDGSYEVQYVPPRPGKVKIFVSIFNRPIKGSPYAVDVSDHINPVWKLGSRGKGEENFVQPVRVVMDSEETLFVSDTGNSRIKVISSSGEVIRHIGPVGLENQGGTGLALTPEGNIAVVNWRTRTVSIVTKEGELVNKFTCSDFQEPTEIAVNSRGEIIVADHGANKMFMFDANGKPLTTFGGKGEKDGQFKLICAIAVGKCDEILVADHRIQIFSRDGKFSRSIPDQKKGQYSGLVVDAGGHILATKIEKGKSFVQVMNSSGKVMFCIDSNSDRLKRPSGLATSPDHHVYVVDLGNDCLKKYRYR